MKITNLTRTLAKKLGMVAVAGGVGLGLAAGSYAAPIAVPDQGFEDHVIDDVSGYAYGAAGQAGDADGWNNPSSANQGVSPWQGLNVNGNGIAGGGASFMYVSSYATGGQADPIGDQAMEVQNVLAQGLGDTFVQGLYKMTVAAAPSNGTELTFLLYDATDVSAPAAPGDVTGNADTISSGAIAITNAGGGPMEDYSFTFNVGAGSPLIGQNIGIALQSVLDDGVGVDNVRLDLIPEPASLALLGLGGVVIACMRRRT